MPSCRTVERLYAALPLRSFRDWLIRAHMEKCPRCQARLLDLEEARRLLVAPGDVRLGDDIWRRLAGYRPSGPAWRPEGKARAWSWAAAAALAAVAVLTSFWFSRQVEGPAFEARAAAPSNRVRIDYVKVGGESARTFVYQPQGKDVIFIWASKNPEKEG